MPSIRLCHHCGTEEAKKKFCSRSCAASHNNSTRTRSLNSKLKTSRTMSGRRHKHGNGRNSSGLKYMDCIVCEKRFPVSMRSVRKTCSTACRTHAKVNNRTYVNGTQFRIKYWCKWTSEYVILESSWEVLVAKWLDRFNIEWYRPKSGFVWTDAFGKDHLYYPDFYLPNQAVYVDPKNPYGMVQGAEKIRQFKAAYYLIVGDVKHCIKALRCLTKRK